MQTNHPQKDYEEADQLAAQSDRRCFILLQRKNVWELKVYFTPKRILMYRLEIGLPLQP